jgi:hypothetical protein
MVAALVRPHPLSARDTVEMDFPQGSTCAAMVCMFWPDAQVQRHVVVFIGDVVIPREYWAHVRPKAGAMVRLGLTAFEGGGGGKKNILALVATIALSIFAPYAAGAILGAEASALAVSALAAGISLVGSMIISALFKPPSINAGQAATNPADAQTYTITGQANQATPYGPMLRVYGRNRIFPRLGAVPFAQTEGPNQFLYMLLDCGYGPLQIEDLKIGDTPLLHFRDVLYRIHPRWKAGDALDYYRNDTTYEVFNVTLQQNLGELRTTAPDTSGIVLDFVFPRGLVSYGERGERNSFSVGFDVYLRPAGSAGAWANVRSFPTTVSKGGAMAPTNPDAPPTVLPPSNAPTSVNIGAFETWRVGSWDYNASIPAGQAQVWAGFGNMGPPGEQVDAGDITHVQVGDDLYIASQEKHTIIAIDPAFGAEGESMQGWYVVTLDTPTTQPFLNGCQSPVIRPLPPPDDPPDEIGQPDNPDPTSQIIILDATPMPLYFSLTIDVPSAQWEVQVLRRSAFTESDRISDTLSWSSIRSLADRPPIAVNTPHTIIELKIRASEQLSGQLQDVNCIATSILPVWNGAAWVEEATQNPAWCYVDVLRGSAAVRAMPDWRIDYADSIKRWADYCDSIVPNGVGGQPEPRVRFDHVVDYSTTTYQLLQSIAAAGRATPTLRDGKHGIIVDEEQFTPVQMFTPRNSWGFNARRTYLSEPHGLRVSFIDPGNNWQEGHIVIFQNGYDANNAITFEDLKLFGVTRYTQATRDGRYMKAQALLRREEFTINCDIENLICTRGDLVLVQHDVLQVGGDSARIVAVAGNQITLDNPFGTLPPGSYGVRIRLANSTVTGPIPATPVAPDAFVLSALPAPAPAVGDLVSWGYLNTETGEYLVKQIAPGDEDSAQLTLAEIARDVYRADEGFIPDYLPPSGGRPVAGPGPAVVGLRVDQVNTTVAREPYCDLVLQWYAPTLGGYPKYKISAVSSNGVETLVAETNLTRVAAVQSLRLLDPVQTQAHTFAVVGIDAIGRQSLPAFVTFTPRDPLFVPDAPQFLSSNAHDKTSTFTWFAPDNPNNPGNAQVLFFEVRYQPSGAPQWSTAMRVTELIPWNVTTVTLPSRNGAYLVKAITASKIESPSPAVTVIAVEDLVIQDIWSTHIFSPTWSGTFDKCEVDENNLLVLTKNTDGTYPARGVFYPTAHELFNEQVQCRIQSFLAADAENSTEVMSTWIPLAIAAPLSTVARAAWGASIWVSASQTEFFTMNEWVPLAIAAPLAGDFTLLPASNWRPLLHGEYIAMDLRFAVVLDSFDPLVTPRVNHAQVDIDFPERREEYADIVVPTTGLNFLFNRPFVFPPSVAVDLQDADAGDYVARGAADKNGMPIFVRDGAGALKGGVVDVSVFGVGRIF